MFESLIKFIMPTWFYNWLYGEKVKREVHTAVKADDRRLSELVQEAVEVDAATFETLTEKQTILKDISDAQAIIDTTRQRCNEQKLTPIQIESFGFSSLIIQKEQFISGAQKRLQEIEEEEELQKAQQEVVLLSTREIVQKRTVFLGEIGKKASSDDIGRVASTVSRQQTDIETAVDDADNLYTLAVANNTKANKDDPAAQVSSSALVTSYRASLNPRDRLRRQASQAALVEVDESINRLDRVKSTEKLYEALGKCLSAITENKAADEEIHRQSIHEQSTALHSRLERLQDKTEHENELLPVVDSLKAQTKKPLQGSKQEKITMLDVFLESISALIKKMRNEAITSSPSLATLSTTPSLRKSGRNRKKASSPGELTDIQTKIKELEGNKSSIEAEIADAQRYVDQENDSSQLSAQMQALIEEKGAFKLHAESRLGQVTQELQLLRAREKLLLLSQRKSSQDLLQRSKDVKTVARAGFLGSNKLGLSSEIGKSAAGPIPTNDPQRVTLGYHGRTASDWV